MAKKDNKPERVSRLSTPGQELTERITGRLADRSEIPQRYLDGAYGPFLAISWGKNSTEIISGSNYSGYHEKFHGEKVIYAAPYDSENPTRDKKGKIIVIEKIKISRDNGQIIFEDESIAKHPYWNSLYNRYLRVYLSKKRNKPLD